MGDVVKVNMTGQSASGPIRYSQNEKKMGMMTHAPNKSLKTSGKGDIYGSVVGQAVNMISLGTITEENIRVSPKKRSQFRWWRPMYILKLLRVFHSSADNGLATCALETQSISSVRRTLDSGKLEALES